MIYELDVFTPVSTQDKKFIKYTINYNSSKFIQNVERYILFTESDPQKIKNTVVLTRDDFPFTREYVLKKLNFHPRSGWVYQQLVKFYFAKDISKKDYILLLDADVFFTKEISFFEENKPIFSLGSEFHIEYFKHMRRILPTLHRVNKNESGIAHHMVINKKIINNMIYLIEKKNNKKFFDVFLEAINFEESESPCSEYEIYFNFVQIYFPEYYKKRRLQWENVPVIKQSIIENYDMISLPYYLKTRPVNLIKNMAKFNLRLIYLTLINTYFLWTKGKD